jgi:hypothetical protein
MTHDRWDVMVTCASFLWDDDWAVWADTRTPDLAIAVQFFPVANRKKAKTIYPPIVAREMEVA